MLRDHTATEILLAHGADPRQRGISGSILVLLHCMFESFLDGPIDWSVAALLVRCGASIIDLGGMCGLLEGVRNPCLCQLLLFYLGNMKVYVAKKSAAANDPCDEFWCTFFTGRKSRGKGL